jgi:hypothetical protein
MTGSQAPGRSSIARSSLALSRCRRANSAVDSSSVKAPTIRSVRLQHTQISAWPNRSVCRATRQSDAMRRSPRARTIAFLRGRFPPRAARAAACGTADICPHWPATARRNVDRRPGLSGRARPGPVFAPCADHTRCMSLSRIQTWPSPSRQMAVLPTRQRLCQRPRPSKSRNTWPFSPDSYRACDVLSGARQNVAPVTSCPPPSLRWESTEESP